MLQVETQDQSLPLTPSSTPTPDSNNGFQSTDVPLVLVKDELDYCLSHDDLIVSLYESTFEPDGIHIISNVLKHVLRARSHDIRTISLQLKVDYDRVHLISSAAAVAMMSSLKNILPQAMPPVHFQHHPDYVPSGSWYVCVDHENCSTYRVFVEISWPILFHPSVFPLVIGYINTIHISELILDTELQRCLGLSECDNLLDRIECPNLAALRIGGNISLPSLTTFLIRHGSLQALYIGPYKQPSFTAARMGYAPDLRGHQLKVYHGSACLWTLLLEIFKFEELESLTVVPDPANGYVLTASMLHTWRSVQLLAIYLPEDITQARFLRTGTSLHRESRDRLPCLNLFDWQDPEGRGENTQTKRSIPANSIVSNSQALNYV